MSFDLRPAQALELWHDVALALVHAGEDDLSPRQMAILLTIYLLVDGATEIATALKLRPESGWGWLMFGGALSVLLGLLIWQQFPLSGAW